MPIKAADNNNNEKPINSIPIFNATNREYKIAVVTPVHSKILLFIFNYKSSNGWWDINSSPFSPTKYCCSNFTPSLPPTFPI